MTENRMQVKPPSAFPFKKREELFDYIPFLLTRLANRWSLDQSEWLRESGLNGTMMRILAALSAFGDLTINQLTVTSVTEQSTTSRTIEQLVIEGKVERLVHPDDQRVRVVSLLPEGRRKLDEISPAVNANFERLIQGIDEEDLKTCINVLQQMVDNICVSKI